MVLGALDDRFGLDWRLRLSVQLGVALVCVVTQGWRLTAFLDVPRIGWGISVVLSTLWIAALVNSFDMLDDMDALFAGVTVIAAGILTAVLLLAPDPTTHRPQLFVAGFLLVLVGALLGFLWHNWPPAQIHGGRGQLLCRLLHRRRDLVGDVGLPERYAACDSRAAVCDGRAAL